MHCTHLKIGGTTAIVCTSGRREKKKPVPELLVPLGAQIVAAERELRYRINVYPRWIERGKITASEAAQELAAMRAIVTTLQTLDREKNQLPLMMAASGPT